MYTTTQAYDAPISTGSGGNGVLVSSNNGGGGLSGGAIAGIVIGVIAAIIILILICLCCCAKGILDGILGLFGLRDRKKRRVTEETEIYESRHHHGSGAGAGRRTWYGTRIKPKRSSVVDEKKSSGFARIATVGGFLGGLMLLLGLKRDRDRKDDKSSVSYGSSYYSDYTSSKSS